jgi:flavin reductase (DIM6/NTAB) family NADH-FMN oxidoreductase RutF
MDKVVVGPQRFTYLMPVTLVGANVDSKPNFMVVASCGEANAEPPMISVAIRHHRYTLRGIRQNLTFSVNVPSCNLIKETDYCGIVSGSKIDKVKACQFKVFYGKLGNAPLLEQCPVNLECRVMHTLNLGSHLLFIGSVEETHVSEDFLTNGKLDITKIKPLIYTMTTVRQYHYLGKVIAPAFSIGRELEKDKQI